jgi:hypothetical protein
MLLRVIDIETTGMAPPAEIIDFGRTDVISDNDGWRTDRPMSRLYKPLNGIPPETMAVHHITEEDFTADTLLAVQNSCTRQSGAATSLMPWWHITVNSNVNSFLTLPLRGSPGFAP